MAHLKLSKGRVYQLAIISFQDSGVLSSFLYSLSGVSIYMSITRSTVDCGEVNRRKVSCGTVTAVAGQSVGFSG